LPIRNVFRAIGRDGSAWLHNQSPQLTLDPKRLGVVIALPLFVWLLDQSAHAQGDTVPPGLEGLDEMFIVVAAFPVLAIGLSFLIFKVTGKAWVFFLAPFFMAGLTTFGPTELTPELASPPDLFIKFGVWAYGAHLLAVAIVYYFFSRTKKLWLFLLAPIVGWIIQFISLLFILP